MFIDLSSTVNRRDFDVTTHELSSRKSDGFFDIIFSVECDESSSFRVTIFI